MRLRQNAWNRCKRDNMLKCAECGNEVSEAAGFCPNCGTKLDESTIVEETETQAVPVQNTKFCSNCGAKIDIKAEICPKCGVRVAGSSEQKSPFLALILSFLFPGLGQFYNGHSKKGIIFIVAAIVSVILYVILIGAILYLIVWIYGLYDAYKSAEAINNGVNVPDEISLNF